MATRAPRALDRSVRRTPMLLQASPRARLARRATTTTMWASRPATLVRFISIAQKATFANVLLAATLAVQANQSVTLALQPTTVLTVCRPNVILAISKNRQGHLHATYARSAVTASRVSAQSAKLEPLTPKRAPLPVCNVTCTIPATMVPQQHARMRSTSRRPVKPTA